MRPLGSPGSRRTGTSQSTPERRVVPYDFRRPIQLSREHARLLHLACEDFAQAATSVFTSSLRRVCTVAVRSIEQRSYGEYVDSLDQLTYLTVFSAPPVEGQALLELPLHAVMTCIDHVLGGPGSATQPERALTDIEGAVARGLVDKLLHELSTALGSTVPMQPQRLGIEYSPQLAQAASTTDVVVVLTLDLELGQTTSRLTLCLPFHGVLPHLLAAAAPAPVSERELSLRAQSSRLLASQVHALPIEVAVRFRPTHLHPVDLDDLSVGDVVRLSHPAVAPLEVAADETTFAYATAGTQGAHLAALVVDTPKENP